MNVNGSRQNATVHSISEVKTGWRLPARFAFVLLCACSSREPATPNPNETTIPPGFTLSVQQVATGLGSPVFLTAPPGDDRLFVLQQSGLIRIIRNGQLLTTPFLDIRARLRSGGEQGLLGLAFHPLYDSNGLFYVNYTDANGNTRVERYARSAADPDVADAATATLLLQIDQPYPNHNGGMILFAPDGMLLIGMGDGGSGGDPHNHGQDRSTLLGDLLRIDVNGSPYSVPPDNPYVGVSSSRAEIWASGLRNPWRFSIDRETNTLFIGDVGQNRREEINAVPVSTPGLNYGWRITEGSECYQSPMCLRNGLVAPILDYGRQLGCTVIGGYVYRGAAIAEIRGHYFYSDFCQSTLRSFRFENGAAVERLTWNIPDIGSILSFGEDSNGELYILTGRGAVWRIVEGPGTQ